MNSLNTLTDDVSDDVDVDGNSGVDSPAKLDHFEPLHKATEFDDVPSHLLAYSLHPAGNKHFV